LGRRLQTAFKRARKTFLSRIRKNAYEKMLKKKTPVFKEDFKSKKFNIPSVIKIVASFEMVCNR